MKFLLLSILLLGGCGTNAINITPDLKNAIAFGAMTELNDIDPKQEKDLLVRLYQTPVMNQDCFVETHGVCQYKYFISVSTFDENPEVNIFKLSNVGEITSISWLAENVLDYVELELTINKYTKEALDNNADLENRSLKILLKLSAKKLIEEVKVAN
jgi:hypothetical protein